MTQTNKPLARAFSDPKKFNQKGKRAAPGATRRSILEGVTGGLCQRCLSSRRTEREQGRGGKFLFKLQTHTTSQDAWELPLSLLSPNDKGQEREPLTDSLHLARWCWYRYFHKSRPISLILFLGASLILSLSPPSRVATLQSEEKSLLFVCGLNAAVQINMEEED